MIQKLICFLLLLFSTINLPLQAAETHRIECVREIQPTLATLRKLPEIEALVQKILAEGQLTIQYNDRLSDKFGGYWDPYKRTILITKRAHQAEADRITTMLFEMHNAIRSKDFAEIDHLGYTRQLSKEEFIRESEYIEYENCLSTARLLDKGIQKGLFPHQSAWPVYDNFEDHYRHMKRTGHADWYATAYKRMG